MLSFLKISSNNLEILQDFIDKNKNKSSYFTYFLKRNSDCVKNHKYTILLMNDSTPIGYGHIDFECNYWLGIYITPEFRGKHMGKRVMENLLTQFKEYYPNEKLFLTVHKDNIAAIKLYYKYHFCILEDFIHDTMYKMELI